MKTNLKTMSLGILALCTLGLTATGAQADWGRDAYVGAHSSYGYERGGWGDDRYDHAYQQSQAFSEQINARQARQMERIRDGAREGRLTRYEFRELMHEQHRIRAMERNFMADGLIDAREFQRLDRALDLARQNIRAEKHDREDKNRYANNHRGARFN